MATRLEDDDNDEVFLLEKTIRQPSPYVTGISSKPGSRRGSVSAGSRPLIISPHISDTELHKRVEALEDKQGLLLTRSKLADELIVELSNKQVAMNRMLADYTGEMVDMAIGGDARRVTASKTRCCGCCCASQHNGGCNIF